jgi:hypothetical protein
MVDVHQRREDQEATREVVVEYTAREPRPWDKQCDAPGNQHGEVSPRSPGALAFTGSFAAGVVTGNP